MCHLLALPPVGTHWAALDPAGVVETELSGHLYAQAATGLVGTAKLTLHVGLTKPPAAHGVSTMSDA
jgi:hypothetical protein